MTLDENVTIILSHQLCDSDQEPTTMWILLGVLSHWVDGGSPFQGETFLLITTLMMTTRAMMISMSTSTSKWSFITSLSFCKNENDICATGHWQVGVFVWAEPGGLQRPWGQHGLWWGAYGPGGIRQTNSKTLNTKIQTDGAFVDQFLGFQLHGHQQGHWHWGILPIYGRSADLSTSSVDIAF